MVDYRALSVLAGLALASPLRGGTNVLEYDVSTGSAGGQSNQTVGWQFDVLAPLTVQALSWADEDLDGLSVAHETGIWAPDGTLLVSVVIPAGEGAELRGIWRSVPVDPITLEPGAGYIVGGLNSGLSTDRLAFNVDLTFVNSSIHFVDATFAPINNRFTRPTSFSSATNGFYGPSFQTGESDCFLVTDTDIACHADGSAFTWTVDGANVCTGAGQTLTFTGSAAQAGEPVCFSLVVHTAGGDVCCTTQLCTQVPDCSLPVLPADLDGDGAVQQLDLLALLSAWGPCPGTPDPVGACAADLDGDEQVGVMDFLIMLTIWG